MLERARLIALRSDGLSSVADLAALRSHLAEVARLDAAPGRVAWS